VVQVLVLCGDVGGGRGVAYQVTPGKTCLCILVMVRVQALVLVWHCMGVPTGEVAAAPGRCVYEHISAGAGVACGQDLRVLTSGRARGGGGPVGWDLVAHVLDAVEYARLFSNCTAATFM
jgi:hypothetical protein